MAEFTKIVTHPGGAHKDDFLACSILVAETGASVFRCEPTEEDLGDKSIAVVDIGHQHQAELGNFDHHQFPRDAAPTCALSLVLDYLGLYEDARAFCEWLEPAEWFDCRGAIRTAKWLGVERDIMFKLNSPIDFTLINRFSSESELGSENPVWQVMRMIGEDLLVYIRGMRKRIDGLSEIVTLWDVKNSSVGGKVAFIERSQSLPEEPTQGLSFFFKEKGIEESVLGVISPDGRGDGYGLRRYEDHPAVDFNRVGDEADVHFVHSSGFLAKVAATEPERLKELFIQAM